MRRALTLLTAVGSITCSLGSWEGAGINLGNTLDAPHEGDWASPAQQQFFVDYAAAGFKTVRIPVRWDEHIGTEEPFAINSTFLDRVTEVVGWALAIEDFDNIIVNSHHDDWLDTNSTDDFAAALPRFEALWTQVAERFAQISNSSRLVFEIFNEPHVMTTDMLNQMNSAIVPILRSKSETRTILLGGLGWMGVWWLQCCSQDFVVDFQLPDGSNDGNLMVEIHDYSPNDFAWGSVTTWGTPQDLADMEGIFFSAASWAEDHGVSLVLGEFGCITDQPNKTARALWYENEIGFSRKYGIGPIAWDDAGYYNIYDRESRTFDQDVLRAFGLNATNAIDAEWSLFLN